MDHVQIHPTNMESQMAIAERGDFLGYDGISCGFDWGVREMGPGDEESAADIKHLIDAGCLHLLAYNGQRSADEVKHIAMTNRLSVHPTGTCLGIEDLDYPALRAPDVDRPPG